ncbi:MAG: hypothetical protein OEW39_13195 [Deltaproteobacteria bacterium]|nr:hypothetical protein [Deltaproteobacteria bacterium]
MVLRVVVLAALLALGTWVLPGGNPAWAQDKQDKNVKRTEKQAAADNSGAEAKEVLEHLQKRHTANQGLTASGRSILNAPPFTVRSRMDDLEFFPCDDCHDPGKSDRRVRKLTEEHTEIVFEHGGGRFWCYDACHNAPDMTRLQQMRGQTVSFDEAYKLCGQCHFERQKDWYFGGHGKRVGAFPTPRKIPSTYDALRVEDRDTIGSWKGERELLNCTACHNPHSPSIKSYKPSPPPRVRAGLEWQGKPEETHMTIWDRLLNQNHQEK